MTTKIFYPERLTKKVLAMRIKSLRSECGLTYDLPFDPQKETRNFMVSYHNQLIDTYNINTHIFEYVR